MPIRGQMHKEIVIFSHSGTLHTNENECPPPIKPNSIDQFHKHDVEQKKEDTEECILYTYICNKLNKKWTIHISVHR